MSLTPPLHPTTSRQQGFALVVIAALFIAFSVVAAAVVERNSALAEIERRGRAKDQLSRLAYALMQYSLVNYNNSFAPFPCPASLVLPVSDAQFGSAVASCETGSPAGINLLPNGLATDNVLRGMVPVRALADYGIDVNDAIDPWNDRIMYVVRRRLTPGSTSAPPPDAAGAELRITRFLPGTTAPINDVALIRPDFILISYGQDRRGGYQKSQTSISIACGSGARRDANCGNGLTFTMGPSYTAFDATTSLTAANSYFDDILTFYTR